MALKFGTTSITRVKFNETTVTKVIYNGDTVWTAGYTYTLKIVKPSILNSLSVIRSGQTLSDGATVASGDVLKITALITTNTTQTIDNISIVYTDTTATVTVTLEDMQSISVIGTTSSIRGNSASGVRGYLCFVSVNIGPNKRAVAMDNTLGTTHFVSYQDSSGIANVTLWAPKANMKVAATLKYHTGSTCNYLTMDHSMYDGKNEYYYYQAPAISVTETEYSGHPAVCYKITNMNNTNVTVYVFGEAEWTDGDDSSNEDWFNIGPCESGIFYVTGTTSANTSEATTSYIYGQAYVVDDNNCDVRLSPIATY